MKWFGIFLILTLIFEPALAARRAASVQRPESERVGEARRLHKRAKTDKAVELLREAIGEERVSEKRALLRMALAVILFEAARDTEAEVEFTKALADGLRIADYAYFYRGILRKKAGKFSAARQDFRKVIGGQAPRTTQNEARLNLADVYSGEGDWKKAAREYRVLRKRLRNTKDYPAVLLGLYKSERELKRRGLGCQWARELYSKYPTYFKLASWGAKLETNEIDGRKTQCRASVADLKTRVRRLQLGGEADRASRELKDLKEGMAGEGAYAVDSMLANHLTSEGHVEEAMKLLMKHYESRKNHSSYLLLLAKAASRAGEYQMAINAYNRAYGLAPRAGRSSSALFQSAFTSYQIQDYDGAVQKFEKLVKVFPSSKLARDSRWYLAWIRYLRGDYAGAYESFQALAKAPKARKRRGRRRVIAPLDSLANDRVRYWSAMSLLKMGKSSEAVPLFQALIRDPAIGYYSVSAYYRLQSIPGAGLPPGIETRLGLKKTAVTPEATAAPSAEELEAAKEAIEQAEAEYESQAAANGLEAEDSPDGAEGGAEASEADVSGEPADEDATEGDDESLARTDEPAGFKDPGLSSRFERTRDLILVGLESAARQELVEIEKRARRSEDRRRLMVEYVGVKNYYRSSYLADVVFSGERLREGLKGEGRQFWEFAYPRAWEDIVTQVSRSSSVPEELIWGVMRAESHFRYDAHSAVGAMGLMQLMPYTGRQVASLLSLDGFEVYSLLNPETNIRLGTRYLQRLLEKFSGSIPLVAAGYNAGPHRVHAWVKNFGSLEMDEWIEHIPFVETRNYVKKVVRYYQVYSLLYSDGEHSLKWLIQPVGVELDEKVPTKEIW